MGNRKIFILLSLGPIWALIIGPAIAATDTANLSVSASVAHSCIISTDALDFGGYDPISTHASSPLDGAGAIRVTCTNGTSATVLLGQGNNPNAGSTAVAPLRRMTDGGSGYLSYDLYSDSGRTAVWGDDASVDVDHTGNGSEQSHTVYGRIPAGQNVPSGSFTDTVLATVSF